MSGLTYKQSDIGYALLAAIVALLILNKLHDRQLAGLSIAIHGQLKAD